MAPHVLDQRYMFWSTKREREEATERARETEEFLKRLKEVLEIRSECPDPPGAGVCNTRAPMAAAVRGGSSL
jgi:hypothetical protein